MPTKHRTPSLTTDDLLLRLVCLSSDEQTAVLERLATALRAAERRELRQLRATTPITPARPRPQPAAR